MHALHRLRESERLRLEQVTATVAQRLARALLRVRGNSSQTELPLTQAEMAALIGASRNAVVNALSELRALGVLNTGRRKVIIVDQAALGHIADGGHALEPGSPTL
jgi:CRP-like cAMP-binding protein